MESHREKDQENLYCEDDKNEWIFRKRKEIARNEIQNLKSSQHENLVKYVNDFYENGCFLIVMEFCSGGDLADAIKNQNGKPFSVDILLTWFGQLTLH